MPPETRKPTPPQKATPASKPAEPKKEPEMTPEEKKLRDFILNAAEADPLTVAEVIRLLLNQDEKPRG